MTVTGASLKNARPLEHPANYHLPMRLGEAEVDVFVPKSRAANRAWRRAIKEKCEGNPAAQQVQRAMCSEPTAAGCLYFLNAFGWTYLQQKIDETGRQKSVTSGGVNVPFITWPVQDEIITEIVHCIENGRNCVVDKSRDMGMSWLIISVFVWFFLFRPGCNFMVMSRVEELVDNGEDPDTIFWKIDYLIRNLPAWLKPRMKRTSMKLANLDLGCTIVGKSTTKNQGRAGRKTAVLLDEAAAMDGLKQIWVSMSHTTSCMIANSTPLGPGFFANLVRSPKVHVLRAPYWDHPLKGRGRYERVNPSTGELEIRSPWLDIKEAEANDPMEISQEVLMDHQGAGYVVFPAKVLNRQALHAANPPILVGEIEFDGVGDRDLALQHQRAEQFYWNDEPAVPTWKLWIDLEEDKEGRWRPPQNRTYSIGIDISWGQAKSNSTMVVTDVETGEQVATCADATKDPAEWARLAVAASLWWGGARGVAFLIWEANGGGGTFGIHVVQRLNARWVYFHIDEADRRRTRTTKYGWHSNPQRKCDLMGITRSAMARDEVKIRDGDIVREAEQYIFYDAGGCGPGELTAESPVASKTHGDRVIGMALSVYGARMCHRCRPPERVAPFGSPAWRRERAAEKKSGKARRVSRRELREQARLPRGYTRSKPGAVDVWNP